VNREPRFVKTLLWFASGRFDQFGNNANRDSHGRGTAPLASLAPKKLGTCDVQRLQRAAPHIRKADSVQRKVSR